MKHKTTWDHVSGFNSAVALKITNIVGSMWCAYVFCILAFVSLPAVLTTVLHLHTFPKWLVGASLIGLVAWIAQTFLQLVLLPVIMVGQNVQNIASDARSEKTFEDAETIKQLLIQHILEDGCKCTKDGSADKI
jgi:hypothetical protein